MSNPPTPQSFPAQVKRLVLFVLLLLPVLLPAEVALRTVRPGTTQTDAVLRVFANQRSPYPISKYITAKFSEHLGSNIYRGMDSQVLINPTFGQFPFRTGDTTPDGIATFHIEEDMIDTRVRYYAQRYGWPEADLDSVVTDRKDALATFWGRVGPRDQVIPSPDTAPSGGRAQRVEVRNAGQGIQQWISFPLHRTRKFEFEIFIRSPGIESFTITVSQQTNTLPAESRINGVSGRWSKFTGTFELDPSFSADLPCRFALTADQPGQFVVQRILVRPADHINGADPDVVKLLRESKMPMLRWPGGNFVSAYRWRDGVGPFEYRPTVPNYAWGGLESNLFGTDEFIQFCRAVGCEPLICINAGTGTPQEAARWVEYCNGTTNTPMGKLRAMNGHPEPYNVRYWEIGNELWGKWQANWTTPRGNADRYHQFLNAMQIVDTNLAFYGCGAPLHWASNWNDILIAIGGKKLQGITDHSLIGGDVPRSVDPLSVYSDYMAAPEVLEKFWSQIRNKMVDNGVESPRLALTELQIFAKLGEVTDTNTPALLTRSNLISASSHAEALYDILLYHTAVRISPFLDIITHSATVNHGGGLRKYDEKVYANPCHYSQTAFAALAGATPVAVQIESPMEKAPLVVPDLRSVTDQAEYASIDALAAISKDELWLSLVNRARTNAIDLEIQLNDFPSGSAAEVTTLTANTPWAENDSQNPTNIAPIDSKVAVKGGKLVLRLHPYTVIRIRVPKR